MGDSEEDSTTCEKQGLVDNGVRGTGLYGTSIQLGLGSLALSLAGALAYVPSSVDKDDAFAFPISPSGSS
jgi:hypothetical protein